MKTSKTMNILNILLMSSKPLIPMWWWDAWTNLLTGGRSNSLWPLTFATSCCGIEFMSLGAARYDMARFGFEVARASPRQADFCDGGRYDCTSYGSRS